MPRPAFPKTLRQFQIQFANEEACQQYLTACRWPEGYKCPRCDHTRGYALVGRRLWECAECGYQASLTSGTVLHKLRRATVNVAREPLRGAVEIDDTWVGGIQAGVRGSRQLKGRRAALVLVAVEKRGTISGRIRMAVLADFKATTINDFLTQNFATGSTIFTDGLKTFTGLDEIFQHVPRTQPLRTELHQGAKSVVPLADRAIGNLQQWLLGTHHGVSRAQLQVYLDEFVFRHNRRRQPMAGFQTLLGLGTVHRSTPYNDIRRAKDLSRPRIQG